MCLSLHFFLLQPSEGLRFWLVAVAVVIDVARASRAFQRDGVGRLRTAFLLRRLWFGGCRVGGFAGVADVGTDWVDHVGKIGAVQRSFSGRSGVGNLW